MDEQQFDFLLEGRAYGIADVTRFDATLRRCATLGAALWGKSPEDLERKLLAPRPEFPSGFALEDYRELLRQSEAIARASREPRLAGFAAALGSSRIISIGGRRFTVWEARCEVLRRAIEDLEKR